MDRFHTRLAKLRRLLAKTSADALLITNFTNVAYLTGFTGDDSYLLVRSDGEVIVSDGRYATQLAEECPGLDVFIRSPSMPMLKAIEKVVRAAKVCRLAIEAGSMTVALRDEIASRFARVELVATTGLVEHLRQIKDRQEVAEIRRAVDYAQRAFSVIRAGLQPGQTEKGVADELEYRMRSFGAAAAAFPTIVAGGARAALPHASATDAPLGGADLVLIDWGACAGQYRSDLTRVLVTGRLSPKLKRVYGVVLRAQLAAIDAIRPGVSARDVDAVARGVIADAGWGKYFGHGLGHGLGLDVHEGPRLSTASTTVLAPGMVVTVEPGVYLPGWGGVRIEDDVLVTRSGHDVLSTLPKQWEEVIVR